MLIKQLTAPSISPTAMASAAQLTRQRWVSGDKAARQLHTWEGAG